MLGWRSKTYPKLSLDNFCDNSGSEPLLMLLDWRAYEMIDENNGITSDVARAIEIVLSATPEQMKEILRILFS